MSVRSTLQIGDPKLKAKNKAVSDFTAPKISQIIEDLTDSMRSGGLIGMAAPQIGENYRILITEPRETPTRPADQTDQLRVYINPLIVTSSAQENVIYEGCGSVLNGALFGPVRRPAEITIEAFDASGHKFRLTCDGILARVIQHEYDHLNGIEFTEKISDYKKLMTADFYLKLIKNSPDQIAASVITKKIFTPVL